MAGGAGSGTLIKGEVGIGFASSSDANNSNGSTAQGSTINGGGNVTLTAAAGDLHATGATLGAGKTLTLDAARNIVLDASQNTYHADGKNSSAGVEVGVGYSVGAQTGVYAYAAANVGQGHSNSDGTTNNNTQLKADTINIGSKGDTTLKGAVATANTVNVDVGGKLAIESVQAPPNRKAARPMSAAVCRSRSARHGTPRAACRSRRAAATRRRWPSNPACSPATAATTSRLTRSS
jgi:filamentous hemagglutinin